MKRHRIAFFGLVLGATAWACQIVAGIERVEKSDPPDAADTAPPPDTSVPSDPCLHVLPAPVPKDDDDPTTNLPDIYIALRQVELVPQRDGQLLGFDLDNACTCDPRPNTRYDGGASCVSTKPVRCDPDGGIDNSVGSALRQFAGFVDIDEAVRLNKRIANGTRTLMMLITSYNGRANDKSVSVGVFTSEGIRTASASGCADSGPSPDSPGFFTPGWCGDDTWTVTESTVDSPDRRRFLPKARGVGHVSNYQFVVNLDGSAEVPFGGYKLSVSSTVAQGRLVPIDANGKPIDTTTPPDPSIIKRWSIEDALLGGRIPVAELVAAMGTANIPGADAGGGNIPAICSSPTLFPLIKQQICDAVDISASPGLDFEKGVACDALSIAIAMTGDQALTGELLPPEDGGANDCFPISDGGGPQRGPPGVTYRCE